MLFTDFTAGGKDYKLRLNTRNVITLEKQIGCNPLMIFGDGDNIPTVTTMVVILYAALQQYQHGISLNDAYDIFDAYLNDEHVVTDFIPVILDTYRCSGLIGKENNEKN